MDTRGALARWFVVLGGAGIIVGGLVAAVTGPFALADGSWLAAYLVLVVGVAQLAFGLGRSWLPARPEATAATVPVELAGWNLGSLGVMVGTLVEAPWLVALGSVGLLVALGLFLRAVARPDPTHRSWWTWAYRALVVLLAASVAVGMVLSVVRAG